MDGNGRHDAIRPGNTGYRFLRHREPGRRRRAYRAGIDRSGSRSAHLFRLQGHPAARGHRPWSRGRKKRRKKARPPAQGRRRRGAEALRCKGCPSGSKGGIHRGRRDNGTIPGRPSRRRRGRACICAPPERGGVHRRAGPRTPPTRGKGGRRHRCAFPPGIGRPRTAAGPGPRPSPGRFGRAPPPRPGPGTAPDPVRSRRNRPARLRHRADRPGPGCGSRPQPARRPGARPRMAGPEQPHRQSGMRIHSRNGLPRGYGYGRR